MLEKFKEKALKSFPGAASEEEALSLLLQMYERHSRERLEALNINAAQASLIASMYKDKG